MGLVGYFCFCFSCFLLVNNLTNNAALTTSITKKKTRPAEERETEKAVVTDKRGMLNMVEDYHRGCEQATKSGDGNGKNSNVYQDSSWPQKNREIPNIFG